MERNRMLKSFINRLFPPLRTYQRLPAKQLQEGDNHLDRKIANVEEIADELRGDHVIVTYHDTSYSILRPNDTVKVERNEGRMTRKTEYLIIFVLVGIVAVLLWLVTHPREAFELWQFIKYL